MKKMLISHTLDSLPSLTDEQRTKLKALAARPDSEIDYSEIPPLTEAFWQTDQTPEVSSVPV